MKGLLFIGVSVLVLGLAGAAHAASIKQMPANNATSHMSTPVKHSSPPAKHTATPASHTPAPAQQPAKK